MRDFYKDQIENGAVLREESDDEPMQSLEDHLADEADRRWKEEQEERLKMTDEQIENALDDCTEHTAQCGCCPFSVFGDCQDSLHKNAFYYIKRLKNEKEAAERRVRDLLSALYKLTDNVWQAYDLCRFDVVKLAKEYGIKEEELK